MNDLGAVVLGVVVLSLMPTVSRSGLWPIAMVSPAS